MTAATRTSQLARLKDVAHLAGVSTATVSRSVNSPDAVSQALRERIDKAIRQLNWVPHSSARALATNRTLTVGAIVPTLGNEHFAKGIETLQEAIEAAGYTLFVACLEYDLDRELRQVRKMVERGVDAMVLVGEMHLPELYALLSAHGTPVINSFTYRPGSPRLCVGVDNYRAIAQSVRYLLDLGHTRFGMLVQEYNQNDRTHARYTGVVDTLASAGLAMRPEHVVEGHSGIETGRNLFRQLIHAPNRPTAIICANGSLGIGAMIEAQAMGISVPGELSIVSFDDFEIMSQLPTPISAIRVPSAAIGRKTAEILIAQLTGKPLPAETEFEAEFFIRASSGPPPTP